MKAKKQSRFFEIAAPVVVAVNLLFGASSCEKRNQDLETKVKSVEIKENKGPNLVVEDYKDVKETNKINKTNEKKNENKIQDYKTQDFSQDSDEVLLARMLFGEARGCSREEKIAVAYSAINRINDGKKWNGTTLREVLLKPYQYSSFNKNDVNRKKLMDPLKYEPKAFEDCLEIAGEVLDGRYKELNFGQTHFFNPKSAKPSWADKIEKIGRIKTSDGESKHGFYREN